VGTTVIFWSILAGWAGWLILAGWLFWKLRR
jgi:hypothetical protein